MCPPCAWLQGTRWLLHQKARLLACDHYHVIFTIPSPPLQRTSGTARRSYVIGALERHGRFPGPPLNLSRSPPLARPASRRTATPPRSAIAPNAGPPTP
jgi:hypothetical protein